MSAHPTRHLNLWLVRRNNDDQQLSDHDLPLDHSDRWSCPRGQYAFDYSIVSWCCIATSKKMKYVDILNQSNICCLTKDARLSFTKLWSELLNKTWLIITFLAPRQTLQLQSRCLFDSALWDVQRLQFIVSSMKCALVCSMDIEVCIFI